MMKLIFQFSKEKMDDLMHGESTTYSTYYCSGEIKQNWKHILPKRGRESNELNS